MGGGLTVHGEELLFPLIISIDNLITAWFRFSKGKRNRPDVMLFGRNLEENFFSLQADLEAGTYQHGSYETFIVRDPKERRVHKATVRDRVVHQAIANVLENVFEPRFIYDSYSCRSGKGSHRAVARLQIFLRRGSGNNRKTIHILKCDVRKFFDSISHKMLFELLDTWIVGEPRLKSLLRIIVGSFERAPGRGLPLGNLTSQWFANVYLHELDWFIKQTLREPFYIRYCDDFVVAHESRTHLLGLLPEIEKFLASKLLLKLHPNKVFLRTWNQGIDFLGYVIKPHVTVIRPKTAHRMLRRVSMDNYTSYQGVCSHANTYELQKILATKSGWDRMNA